MVSFGHTPGNWRVCASILGHTYIDECNSALSLQQPQKNSNWHVLDKGLAPYIWIMYSALELSRGLSTAQLIQLVFITVVTMKMQVCVANLVSRL